MNLQWSRVSRYPHSHHQQYYFQTPFDKYYDLVKEMGSPTLVNPKPGGIATWHSPSYQFLKRIDIIDEQCYNRFPYPHVGFLYTYYPMIIPIDQVSHVLSLSGDILYDNVKHLLIVRGMSLYYNLSLTALVHRYVHDKVSWYQIVENDLVHYVTDHKRLMDPKYQHKILREICLSKK
jgi:hypothetical protein